MTDRILLVDYGASKRLSSGQRDVVGESSRRCIASIIGVMLFIGGKLLK